MSEKTARVGAFQHVNAARDSDAPRHETWSNLSDYDIEDRIEELARTGAEIARTGERLRSP